MYAVCFTIIAAGFSLWFFWKMKSAIHMLQQNSYISGAYLKWVYQNIRRNITIFDLLPYLIYAMSYQFGSILLASICFAATFALLYAFRPKNIAKKPLVVTSRVGRLIITGVILTMAAYTLLFLWIAPIWQALLLVMLGVFTPLWLALINMINRPMELSIHRWYYLDAKKMISGMPNLTVIGITGSYGKTSSKFILGRILSEKYNTLITPESYNTTMGVIKTIRTMLRSTHQVFVCEMGAKGVGEIKEICDLVLPTYGLITSIGPQHLDTFKSIENIVKTKFELAEALADKNNLVINLSSQLISKHNPYKAAVGYAIEKLQGAQFWAEEVSYGSFGCSFKLCDMDGNSVPIQTKLLGLHNVLNIVGAAAMARRLGVQYEKIAYAVLKLQPVAHRLELKSLPGGISVIDDAFNSNREGAKSAVEVLGCFPKGGRILITPGIVELGDKQNEYNVDFGMAAAAHCDYVILVGKKQTKPILEGLTAAGFDSECIYIAEDLKEALAQMRIKAVSGSTVLFENDLPDLYNE